MDWKTVAKDGMPPCGPGRAFVGRNKSGWVGAFNRILRGDECETEWAGFSSVCAWQEDRAPEDADDKLETSGIMTGLVDWVEITLPNA